MQAPSQEILLHITRRPAAQNFPGLPGRNIFSQDALNYFPLPRIYQNNAKLQLVLATLGISFVAFLCKIEISVQSAKKLLLLDIFLYHLLGDYSWREKFAPSRSQFLSLRIAPTLQPRKIWKIKWLPRDSIVLAQTYISWYIFSAWSFSWQQKVSWCLLENGYSFKEDNPALIIHFVCHFMGYTCNFKEFAHSWRHFFPWNETYILQRFHIPGKLKFHKLPLSE